MMAIYDLVVGSHPDPSHCKLGEGRVWTTDLTQVV